MPPADDADPHMHIQFFTLVRSILRAFLIADLVPLVRKVREPLEHKQASFLGRAISHDYWMRILGRNGKQLYFILNGGVLLFGVHQFSLFLSLLPNLPVLWGKQPASILTVKKNDSAIPTTGLSVVSKANTVAFRAGCLPVSPVVRIISTETSIT